MSANRYAVLLLVLFLAIGVSHAFSQSTDSPSSSSTGIGPAAVVPTVSQKLYNATCPYVNPNALSAANAFNTTGGWCSGGQVDGIHQCSGSVADCESSPAYHTVAQGIEQDSVYSTNPPYWWRCNYTTTTESVVNGTSVAVDAVEQLQVVSPLCFTDPTQCQPQRYLTQVNNLNVNGAPQWAGQLFPPYAYHDQPPLAIVVAGAAFVNASLFYPFIDYLQLLQVQQSANEAFLSLSASTRVAVEIPGGVISNSRTRISTGCGYVVPFFTLIIDLASGYPESAEWQDDCSTCTAEAYVYSDDGSCNCGVPVWSCIGFNATAAATGAVSAGTVTTSSTSYTPSSIDCDLKVYVAYSGSDRNGNVLTSSSRTLAHFREWSFGELYKNLVNNVNNMNGISNSFGSCTEWVTQANGERDCVNWGG